MSWFTVFVIMALGLAANLVWTHVSTLPLMTAALIVYLFA